MTKSFKIQYEGKEEEIEIITPEDKPRASIITKILKNGFKFSLDSPVPIPDAEEYPVHLITNLVTKAPWKTGDLHAVRMLDFDTLEAVCFKIGDEWPVERFLFLAGKLTYGRKLELPVAPTQLTDSTSSSASSDSPSER